MFNGEKLAELRKDRGLRQADLAKMLGVSREKLSTYERNLHAPPDYFKEAVAKHFNISLDYLMDLTHVEVSFVRSRNIIELPPDFPDSLIPEVRHSIEILFNSYKYNQLKE